MSQSLENLTTTRIFRHARPALFIIALLLLAGIGLRVSPSAAEDARAIPAPALDELAVGASFETTSKYPQLLLQSNPQETHLWNTHRSLGMDRAG
jgi:hypothetical protein